MTHDIYATPADRPRWYNKAVIHAQAAYGLLPRYAVENGRPGATKTMAAVPSAVTTVDAFLGGLTTENDPGGLAPEQTRRNAIAVLLPGECRLAADIIDMALEASSLPGDCEERQGARAWLQDHSDRGYSARVCFESLGYDYDEVRKLLLKRWLQETP